ncbi:molybdopterin-dependent oxidoreductase [Nocardia sp. NPDC002869]|uniref:molybdopterin-dependent oxidoreductase n=1 Tax=Nocardia sp. NPDC002869 TaxID=3161032 RepID=UPI00398CECE0
MTGSPRPAIRLGYYRDREHSDTTRRGREPFVEVDWDEALDIAAGALRSTRERAGNRAIYGGSYGWASAGRFHHTQGQIHRFLRMFGGYTASVDTYSFAAAEVTIPHVLGMNAYYAARQSPTTEELARHCARIVFFGGAAARNAQVNPGSFGAHGYRDLAGLRLTDAVRPAVVHMATGAWYDPLDPDDPESLDVHGNPNTVTLDIGTSSLAQGPSVNSCLVEIERYAGDPPPLRIHRPPELISTGEVGAHPA